ncbi:protein translocase subunit SecD [Candidatus Foliamicus sp.]
MNRYPLWKNLVVLIAVAGGCLIALPNLYGDDPAVLISREDESAISEVEADAARRALSVAGIEHLGVEQQDNAILIRFASVDTQLGASDLLREELGAGYVLALTLLPRTPQWLAALGLKPMNLGLDLRGGVHFLFEVDTGTAVRQRVEGYADDFSRQLRDAGIRRSVQAQNDRVRVDLRDADDLDRAEDLLAELEPELDFESGFDGTAAWITGSLGDARLRELRDNAISQNITTLRNRVNELGVAEPLVQRQGLDRIVVQLPGVQDPAQASRILGSTATVEFRLVCYDENQFEAARLGRAPIGCELFYDELGQPYLLRRAVIAGGKQLVDARQGFSEDGQPAVHVALDGRGADAMLEATQENLQRPMAVLFIEKKRGQATDGGEPIVREERKVINEATIRGVFSSRFQITGLNIVEARDLALLLRAGALEVPIFKVEERTVGPSLGQDNIDQGMRAIIAGLLLVVLFISLYYRVFGMIATLALGANMMLIVALLSLLQAALTLPGIAGIVLTVGMAVDANVLIFERIREELRNGNSPQASIRAGYDKALVTIADANITTLIAALVLFTFGTGPIKGFAVTLSLGILGSMFTAIVGTRSVVNLIYGGRRLSRLAV